MVDKHSGQEEPMEEALSNNDIDNMPEDSFISESFSSLSEVPVPSGFLPNVMFQVYERHHRGQIKWPLVIGASLLLSLLAGIFFAMDVSDYQAAQGLGSFDEALSEKVEQISTGLDTILAGFTGILSATWKFIVGGLGIFFEQTPVFMQILIGVGILALLYFLKKGLSGLVGK